MGGRTVLNATRHVHLASTWDDAGTPWRCDRFALADDSVGLAASGGSWLASSTLPSAACEESRLARVLAGAAVVVFESMAELVGWSRSGAGCRDLCLDCEWASAVGAP